MNDVFCEIGRVLAGAGVTTTEAEEAVARVVQMMPPPGPEEIALVRMNPSLTRFQKWRIIRQIRGGK